MSLPANSRYHDVGVRKVTLSDGAEVAYFCPRLLPDPEQFVLVTEYIVQGSEERLDIIASKTIGDPELAWRIADASGAMRPNSLTEIVGQQLRIPFAVGAGVLPLA